ncbi:MAG: hypothetical protein R2706_06300 [Acidimicrobiales bacterium]
MRDDELGLPQKIVAIHEALVLADVDHAFGGALALAWCTERARGTIDIDINIFVSPDEAERVVGLLPVGVSSSENDLSVLGRDGQARLWWGNTPVDVFLNTTDYHPEAAGRRRFEPFMGASIPFLACDDLAVFKAFFNRTKDWADLEEMSAAGSLNVEAVAVVLATYLGPYDDRIARLYSL